LRTKTSTEQFLPASEEKHRVAKPGLSIGCVSCEKGIASLARLKIDFGRDFRTDLDGTKELTVPKQQRNVSCKSHEISSSSLKTTMNGQEERD
jgi:hypothetical protein